MPHTFYKLSDLAVAGSEEVDVLAAAGDEVSNVHARLAGVVLAPRIRVPAESQTGKTFRLRGKGIKGVRSQYPGDLCCHLVVETPVALTERQRQLLREFESISQQDGARHNPRTNGWFDKVKEFFAEK